MAKTTIGDLFNLLTGKIKLLNLSTDQNEKQMLKVEIRKLQSRIANRERYDAMRSLGLVKTPYGWE